MNTSSSSVGLFGDHFVLSDASTWSWVHVFGFVLVNVVGFEILDAIFRLLEKTSIKKIPINGPHHDALGVVDISYLIFNKLTTPLFIYHLIQFSYYSPKARWSFDEPLGVLINSIVTVPLLFALYDLFYVPFHRTLHNNNIYKYIHKHHHQQHAPTRGLNDAINTHPVEYILGQWNHLLSIYLLSLVMDVHVISIFLFMAVGAVMAGLNHTRLDLGVGWFYQVKHHDAHHRYPNANFGQYLVLFDMLTGSFKESRDAGKPAGAARATTKPTTTTTTGSSAKKQKQTQQKQSVVGM